MTAPRCSDQEFIDIFKKLGPQGTATHLGVSTRNVYSRRRNLEAAMGISLDSPTNPQGYIPSPNGAPRIHLEIENGIVLIGSDAHYWPKIITTAHRAFVRACRELQPHTVIMNGDVFDGASISRHAPIGWESRPSVIEEIECCQERLGEIEAAAGKARKIWSLGNHDARFESRLAAVAPEYARVHGIHLRDHFAFWESCWATWINEDVVVKHRYKGGIHATHNNTLGAGKTMVTGHLHSLKATPYTDYNGTRWGVDSGTLSGGSFEDPQFVNYLETNPVNWRSGFVVLTFWHGRLLQPELALVIGDGQVDFRGKVWEV